jgi:hypothetical protein
VARAWLAVQKGRRPHIRGMVAHANSLPGDLHKHEDQEQGNAFRFQGANQDMWAEDNAPPTSVQLHRASRRRGNLSWASFSAFQAFLVVLLMYVLVALPLLCSTNAPRVVVRALRRLPCLPACCGLRCV